MVKDPNVLMCARVPNVLPVGIQQSGSVPWAAGGKGRASGEED